MSTTTVYDTLRTVIYDTVHTVSFDTIRTFDTVKVQLDSVFTIDLLNKSQEFYVNAFDDVKFLLGVFVSIFCAVVGVAYLINTRWTIGRIKEETRRGVEDETSKALERFEDEQKKNLEKCRKEMDAISLRSATVTNKMLFAILAQAKITEDSNNSLRMYHILVKFVNDEFDVVHITLVEIAVKEMMVRFFGSVVHPELNATVCKNLYEELGKFRRRIYDIDDAEIKKFVEEFDPFITGLRKELSERF